MVARELQTRYFSFLFFSENGISSFFRNVATYLPDYITSRLIFGNVDVMIIFFHAFVGQS